MRLHSEEQVCPRRKNLYTPERVLSGGQSERGGHRFWDTEQRERDPASRRNSCIASEPKRPVEAVMCALRTGQGCRDRICAGREPLLLLDVHALITKQLDARPSVMPTTPVIPEERLISNHEWMQQHAHLARLFGGAPIPLALLTQLTGTTTANAGGVHQPQAPLSLLPPLLERERAACGAAQGSIRLERKILAREATCFPGRGSGGWAISRGRSRCGRTRGSLCVLLWDGRSKLGDARGRWFQLMPQFQPQVPDPLSHQLPTLLSPGRMRAPPVGILLDVFVC